MSFARALTLLSALAFLLFELFTSFQTSGFSGYNDLTFFSETKHPNPPGYQRMVFLEEELYSRQHKARSVEPLGGPCAYCEREPFDYIRDVEKPYYEECTLMADWQSAYYPTCLALHELNIAGNDDDFALVSLHGNWRSVWKYQHNNETVAVKLLQLSHEFDRESLNYHRVDAMVMERLTSSPYIVNVFQFCGESAITEWATGSARDYVKDERWRSRERLELGLDLARALLALHSIDYPNSTNATLAHNDINMANAIEVNGKIKLNDFNIAQLLRWNKTKPCGIPVRFQAPFWKSPEENAQYHREEVSYVDATKTDVYGLGNLLFQVLTKRQPWTHLEPNGMLTAEEVKSKKEQGKLKVVLYVVGLSFDAATVSYHRSLGILPSMPEKYSNSTKPANQALYYATVACFRFHPEDRPTAYQLVLGLEQALEWVQAEHRIKPEAFEALFAVS
jgi:serine/threonine protein kinase